MNRVCILALTFLCFACGEAPERITTAKGTGYSSKLPKDGDAIKKPGKSNESQPAGDAGDDATSEIPEVGSEVGGMGTGKDQESIPVIPDSGTTKDPVAMPLDCKSFSWESIKKPEDTTCFKSIAEAIASLPEAVKPYWIMMKDSRSAQKSSLEKPRLIINSPDGSFLLGAATDSASRQDLEVAVYDYEKSEWQFAGIDFSSSPPKVEKELCKSCHGSEPHPIWKQYGGWTGAFASNNFLSNDEAAFLKKVVSKDADVPDLLKLLSYRSASSYSSGSRLAPASKTYGGEENGQVLNYVTMQKAAQTTVAKMLRDPSISAVNLLEMSAEISCKTNSGTLKRFGYSIAKDLSFALEGMDRGQDMFNGRFSSSHYLAAELIGRALSKDASLKMSLTGAAKVFADPRYRYFTTKSLGEYSQFISGTRNSIRSLQSDFLYGEIGNVLKSQDHCDAIKSLSEAAQ